MNIKNGNLKIFKIDKDNEKILLGSVKFDLYDEDNEKIGTYITNENGEIDIPSLRIGKYKIKEISTNKWYNLAEDNNIEIKWNENTNAIIENELKKGQVKIIKVDSENKDIRLENVKFEVLDENKNVLEKIKTDSNGEALTSKYAIRDYNTIYLKEIKTNDKYILDNQIIKVDLVENEIKVVTLENVKIKGKIKIIKTSGDDNKVIGIKKGDPIEGVIFEIYDENNKIVETIKTDKEGIAISSRLDKGEYKVKETQTNKWYYLNKNTFKVEINNNDEIVELNIKNDSKNPEIYTEKIGQDKVQIGKNVEYDISIKNTGNTSLENVLWIDEIPTEYIKVLKFNTGTYNQKISYNIYYKTNFSNDEYILLMEDLNSLENYEIDFSKELANNEYVTAIKLDFGKLDIGFSNNENIHLLAQTKHDLKSETTFVNTAKISGEYQGYKVTKNSSWKTLVYKLLPKTGF